jgi:hypothetical protein
LYPSPCFLLFKKKNENSYFLFSKSPICIFVSTL